MSRKTGLWWIQGPLALHASIQKMRAQTALHKNQDLGRGLDLGLVWNLKSFQFEFCVRTTGKVN